MMGRTARVKHQRIACHCYVFASELLGLIPKVNAPRTARTVVFDNARTLTIRAGMIGGKERRIGQWMGTLTSEAVNTET